jgi:hypothetical protein
MAVRHQSDRSELLLSASSDSRVRNSHEPISALKVAFASTRDFGILRGHLAAILSTLAPAPTPGAARVFALPAWTLGLYQR